MLLTMYDCYIQVQYISISGKNKSSSFEAKTRVNETNIAQEENDMRCMREGQWRELSSPSTEKEAGDGSG